MTTLEIIKSITGRNENGSLKAACALQEQKLEKTENGIEVSLVNEASTTFAVAGIAVEDDKIKATLTFESFEDIDYIRMCQVIKDNDEREVDENCILVLSMTDVATLQNYVILPITMVALDGVNPVVRLVGNANDARVYSVPEEELDKMLEDAAKEENF